MKCSGIISLLNLTKASSSGRGGQLAATLFVGCMTGALNVAADPSPVVNIPTNGDLNLVNYVNSANPGSNNFFLTTDVYMTGAATISNADQLNIYIDGNGKTIEKRGDAYAFLFDKDMKGASLTLTNATITSSASTNYALIMYVTAGADNTTLNLNGTTFYRNPGTTNYDMSAFTTGAKNTRVLGDVVFSENSGSGIHGGAVSLLGDSSLEFVNKVSFINNQTLRYGGAIEVAGAELLKFADDAVFSGNRTVYDYGGAMNIAAGSSTVIFEKDATFTGNYVRDTGDVHKVSGVRGGAIHVGAVPGTNAPQIRVDGLAIFEGNYVWADTPSTMAFGGALAFSPTDYDPLGSTNMGSDSGYIYGGYFEQAQFTNNYTYSADSDAYGGAVFGKSYGFNLTFGSGSSFTGNMAKTLGGAIFFDQGELNLNGNVTFSGNRHGVDFATAGNVLTPDLNSGRANAIYFAVSSNTATLNLNAGSNEVIGFEDPIESAAGKSVTVNKDGLGTVFFSGNDSDILAVTMVSAGTFELRNGARYGRLGANGTSSFNLSSGAVLKGGENAILRANVIQIDGRLEVAKGVFGFESVFDPDKPSVVLSKTSVLALTINSVDDYSSISLSGDSSIKLEDAYLEIDAEFYIPSLLRLDTFTIVSGLSDTPVGMFIQGKYITINGADFEIIYGSTSIYLQQLVIPEPSTYALLLAVGCVGFAWVRRQKKQKPSLC